MTSVYQAEHVVLNAVKPLPLEIVPLSKAHGRLLREPIRNDRDQPPFDKALMDGIAIHSSSYEKGTREFHIETTIAAGDKPYKLKTQSNCVEIMTGAVLPDGCNAIVPIEQVSLEADKASLKGWTLVKQRQNIRFKGSDSKKGQLLIKDPCRLLTPHIGILASVGKTKVKVASIPRIAIISTGNELVDIDKTPKPFQTRLSNSYTLKSLIEGSGLGSGEIFHYADNKKALLKGIGQNLKAFDMLILSGGVSMGQFDYVPQVLKELGVKALFHKVAQKPGRPFWFGTSKTGKTVFALPGNPVSTQICAYRYVIPYLKKAAGLKSVSENVVLSEMPEKPGDYTEFIPVKIFEKNGTRYAQPVSIGGSGDFAALASADGFIEYDHNPKSVWPYFSWRV
jgi:molybdopterin molybdotransferase